MGGSHHHERHVVAGKVTSERELSSKDREDEGTTERLPPVALLGPPGLVRDLVSHLLRSADAPLFHDIGAGSTEPAVAVLVDPEQADWDSAAKAKLAVVLVVAAPLDDDALLDAVLRGADAVVEADNAPALVLKAIEVVAQGNCLLGPHQARIVVSAARAACRRAPAAIKLTDRERDILRSIERGESVKQTAVTLGITSKTVENLQSRLFRKLGVRNRAEAVSQAHQLGLMEPSG